MSVDPVGISGTDSRLYSRWSRLYHVSVFGWCPTFLYFRHISLYLWMTGEELYAALALLKQDNKRFVKSCFNFMLDIVLDVQFMIYMQLIYHH